MIEGGNYHDSLEELFTLQKIAESKVIKNKYSLSISDSKSPETCSNRYVFYFLDSLISVQYVNVALSYESDRPASVNELKKATKKFSNYLETSIHIQ